MPFSLQTKRLLIKPLSLGNLDDYAAIVADPDVMKYLNEGVPRSRECASKYLEDLVKIQKELGFSRYGVWDKKSGSLLGHCGYKNLEGRIDIGWTFAKSVWGKGIGSEAAQRVIDHGFEDLGFALITARTIPVNLGSVGVMKSVGMKFASKFFFEDKDYPDFPGIEVVEYQITKKEWQDRRKP